MKAILDSNVVIDALRPNPGFETDARRVFRLILEPKSRIKGTQYA